MFNNVTRILTIILMVLFSTKATLANNLAALSASEANKPVQCQVIINKNPSWIQENVKIDIVDLNSKKIIQSMNLAAKTQSTSSINQLIQTYDCNKYPKIEFQASYTPSIWSTDKGKVYPSKNIYDLTNQILTANSKGIKILQITLTFPDDFISVPPIVN